MSIRFPLSVAAKPLEFRLFRHLDFVIGALRGVIITLLIPFAFGVASSSLAAPANIVLFIADDFSWRDSATYGNPEIRTPNMDQLAREGMKFNNAFATSPTCTPSRCSILTGLMPLRNGAHSNHTLINEGIRTLPSYFKYLGYRVAIAGKTHFGPREQFPFEYLTNSNVMPPGKNAVLWTDLNTDAVEQFLADHAKNHPTQPLCLIVASHSPHVYWMEADGYDPAKIKLPPFLLDTLETRKARARYYTEVTYMDKQLGDVLASLKRHNFADQTLIAFTGDQGAQWPFGKWNLYDEGIRTPLLVRWPGQIKPNSTSEAFVSLVDLLPTFLEAAEMGRTDASPAGLDGRSFLPVLLGKTNQHRSEIFATHTGDKEMNRTPMRAVRTDQFKYILNLLPDAKYTTHISEANGPDGRVYWDTWVKLAEHDSKAAAVIQRYRTRPPEELYDIASDPYEQHNLANDPAHATNLAELREKVRQWRVQQKDRFDKPLMPEDGRIGPLRYAN